MLNHIFKTKTLSVTLMAVGSEFHSVIADRVDDRFFEIFRIALGKNQITTDGMSCIKRMNKKNV